MKNYSIGMLKISENLNISVFFLISVLLLFYSQGFLYSALIIISALIHEGSHLFFLKRYGAQIKNIYIFPFGIDISADTSRLSYKKEIAVALSGSLSNLCLTLISCCFFTLMPSSALLFFALCNLFLGIFNLIPLSFFDGGKALRLFIYDIFSIDKAFYIYKAAEILSSLFFLTLCVFSIYCSNFNFSVIAVVLYASVSSLAQSSRYLA